MGEAERSILGEALEKEDREVDGRAESASTGKVSVGLAILDEDIGC